MYLYIQQNVSGVYVRHTQGISLRHSKVAYTSFRAAGCVVYWLALLPRVLNDYGSILAAGRNFWRVVG